MTHATPPGGTGGHGPEAPGRSADAKAGGEHGHRVESLGPIDVAAWGAGVLGVLIGLAMTICFVLATGGLLG